MQLEQATHTALKVRKDVGQSFKWQVGEYLINQEMQSFCGWVSSYSFPWFSQFTFQSVHKFKNSESRQNRTCYRDSFYYRHIKYPQNLIRKTAWLIGWGCACNCWWLFHESWMSKWIHCFRCLSTNGLTSSGFTAVGIKGSGFRPFGWPASILMV